MSAEAVLRSMRTRVPWAVARRVLKSQNLNRSMGWDRTLARVVEDEDGYDDAEEDLTDALEEHLMCGEKIVRCFQIDDEDMDGLRARALEVAVSDGSFASRYPLLLNDEELADHRGAPPVVAAVVQYVKGTAIVLASARYLTSREVMHPDELPQAAADELAQFSEIIGIRHRRIEAADILWIPNETNTVELRVDFPYGMPQRHGDVALDAAQARFTHALGANYFGQHVNLFPAISSLYGAVGDGAMVELGFMVSGSAQKLEKTRRDGQCCREEAYHVAGVAGLDAPIAPYRASVMWRNILGNAVESFPEVSLTGTSLNTAEAAPFLGEMVVRNCANFSDYDHVRDRILSHL